MKVVVFKHLNRLVLNRTERLFIMAFKTSQIFDFIKLNNMKLSEVKEMFQNSHRMVMNMKDHPGDKYLELSFYKAGLEALEAKEKEFKQAKQLLHLKYDSPSSEQIVECIQMYVEDIKND